MKRETVICPECGISVTVNNIKKHINSKTCKQNKKHKITQIDESWKQPNGKYTCPYCGKEYSKNGISTHIWRSHGEGKNHNPNIGFKNGNRQIWNKGLTKETDERVRKSGQTYSKLAQKQIADGTYPIRRMGKEARQRLSERQSLHNTGGRCKWYKIDNVFVQGRWERDCVLKFNEFGIEWKKIKKEGMLNYSIDDKIKRYTPDILLPQFDITLEIKGYWWGNDEEKMKCVLADNPDKGDEIRFVFGNEFKAICNTESKEDLVETLNNLTTLQEYFK